MRKGRLLVHISSPHSCVKRVPDRLPGGIISDNNHRTTATTIIKTPATTPTTLTVTIAKTIGTTTTTTTKMGEGMMTGVFCYQNSGMGTSMAF